MSKLGMISIGQYVPGDSIIHRLDPRTKIIILFAYMFSVFTVSSIGSYVSISLFAIISIILAHVSFRFIWRSLKPLWVILAVTFIFHVWSRQEGVVLLDVGIFSIYDQGLIHGASITWRIAFIILLASLLMLTTKPLVLSNGLERLMKPLKKVRLPVHEFALMVVIALRFIPTLLQEVDKLIKAQSARGAQFSSGPIFKRVMTVIPIIIPLFISSFQRADDLALAMESRAYRGGEGRTQLVVISFRQLDMIILFICFLYFLFVFVFFNYFSS